MKVDQAIFKAYDIRGYYPEQITPNFGYHLGRSISTYLSPQQMVIGRDMRISSKTVHGELVSGFLESAVDVVDIGLTSTDVFYHACAELNSPGVMITASHNPPEYGGFKIVKDLPYVLGYENGLQEIYQLILTEDYSDGSQRGKMITMDFSQSFVNKMFSIIDVKSIRDMKIVADTGNGMSGPILQDVFACLPQIELIHINEELNGVSPAHGWDPLQPENHQQLQQRVIDEKADLGFAFDGDGDRFFAIDDKGNFFPGDFLTAFFTQHFLKKAPYSKIVYDVRSSWAIVDKIEQLKGIPIQEKVGHSFIKKRMVEEDAIFGGELTGHYYFRDFYFMDSAVLPSLILIEILSDSSLPLSEILFGLQNKYFLSGEINISVKKTSESQNKIQKLEDFFKTEGKIEKLDGISIIFEDWNFNLRFSNTEPLMRLNLEARSKVMLEEKLDLVLNLISQQEN